MTEPKMEDLSLKDSQKDENSDKAEKILLTSTAFIEGARLEAYGQTVTLMVEGRRVPEETMNSRIFNVFLSNGEKVYRLKVWKQDLSDELMSKFRIGNVCLFVFH